MKKPLLIALTAVLLVCLSTTTSTFAAEEQTFIGELSLRELRAQIDEIEKEVYRVFNSVNDDDQLDIVCHYYLATGTSIKKEVCEAQFVIDRRRENAKTPVSAQPITHTATTAERIVWPISGFK